MVNIRVNSASPRAKHRRSRRARRSLERRRRRGAWLMDVQDQYADCAR
jgi:hypothetical protein